MHNVRPANLTDASSPDYPRRIRPLPTYLTCPICEERMHRTDLPGHARFLCSKQRPSSSILHTPWVEETNEQRALGALLTRGIKRHTADGIVRNLGAARVLEILCTYTDHTRDMECVATFDAANGIPAHAHVMQFRVHA